MTTTDAETPTGGIRYDVRKDGEQIAIYRIPPEGTVDLVATMNGTTIVYANETMARYAPALKRALNKQLIPYTASVVGSLQQTEPVETKEQTMTTVPQPPPQVTTQVDPLAGLPVEVRKCIRHLRDKEGFPVEIETEIEEQPDRGPEGDKTPEFVMWLLRFDPRKFHETYQIIGFGKVKESSKYIDPRDNMVKEKHEERSGVLTMRKTHLTLVDPQARRAKK